MVMRMMRSVYGNEHGNDSVYGNEEGTLGGGRAPL